MMNKPEFTKIAKNILNSQKQLKNPQIVHPSREWLIGIFVALVIFGGTSAWSLQTYKQYQNTSVDVNKQSEVDVVYRESLVKAALEKFLTRSQNHAIYIKGSLSEAIVPNLEGEETATSTELIDESSSETTASSSAVDMEESSSEGVSPKQADTTTVESSADENIPTIDSFELEPDLLIVH